MISIRPLIVDDSVVVRKTLVEAFASAPDIQECAVAANGRIALELIPLVKPSVVILDLEMPIMNGLETLKEIRQLYPSLPVIMFSSITETGAKQTIDALSLGASDYVTKPAGEQNFGRTIHRIRNELIPKLRAICKTNTSNASPVAAPKRHSSESSPKRLPAMLVIGSSTGGPVALEAVLSRFPSSFPLPIVIAQHMPPIFTARLADRLNCQCSISVSEAFEPFEIRKGHAFIAPGSGNVIIEQKGQSVWCEPIAVPQDTFIKPSVDVLFESAANVFGDRLLAVVLSGMGSDGRRGCEFVQNRGGHIIVQDEASSVVWGMPGSVAKAGLSNQIVPLSEIGNVINQRVHDLQQRTVSV